MVDTIHEFEAIQARRRGERTPSPASTPQWARARAISRWSV
jgi:hypothetical protein